ncbi:Dirigent protein 23 [Striga hermonthica]|uniref:Dirigent protein n=1 Tax=Striga hermonthica TaxID=68872 RepID=A0A9N7R0N7_STRHE|nr:Dirigent protein 23 [Striga hermonthica]
MGFHHFLLMLSNFLLLSMITISSARFSEKLIEPITAARMEKTTKLHFYFHDKVSEPNATAVRIIGDRPGFGMTVMMDDALTEGPDRGSKVVGRAQGLYSIAAQNDLSLLMVATYVFLEGSYKGSSISVLGRNHVFDDVREMPIVGGSGVFRLGRGYALAHTVWADLKTGDVTVEYNVTVLHF